jgi:hypothetical protein
VRGASAPTRAKSGCAATCHRAMCWAGVRWIRPVSSSSPGPPQENPVFSSMPADGHHEVPTASLYLGHGSPTMA